MSSLRFPSNIIARILEALVENSGTIKDSELFEILRREFDLSFSDLIKYLMILELRGYVSVSASKENVRVISLTRYGKDILRKHR